MANPYFYLYYTDGGALAAHDFGRSISDLVPRPVRARVDARGGDGSVSSVVGPASMRVTVRRERTSDQSLVRMWRNVEDHLLVGGRVGFSWDHARTWASWASSPSAADTVLYTSGNAFSAWSAAAALSATDEIVLESPNPEGRREYTTVSSVTSRQITISSGLRNTFALKPMVRWSGFWPALYLPEDQLEKLRISSDRNITWNLDFELEVDQRILTIAQKSGTVGALDLRDGSTKPGAAGRSLEGLLGRDGGGSIAGSRAGSGVFGTLYGRR